MSLNEYIAWLGLIRPSSADSSSSRWGDVMCFGEPAKVLRSLSLLGSTVDPGKHHAACMHA
jgi:hypothetical protein